MQYKVKIGMLYTDNGKVKSEGQDVEINGPLSPEQSARLCPANEYGVEKASAKAEAKAKEKPQPSADAEKEI